MTWTNVEGHVVNLTCPAMDLLFQCPSISEDYSRSVISGELFIGTNFTEIALDLKNGADWAKDLHGNANPLMIALGYGTDRKSGNFFWLFPNVHIRATLAVVYRQLMTNTNKAAFGLQKVGGDAQNNFHHGSLCVQYEDSYTFSIDKVFPDPDPPILGENVSSLRIFIPSDTAGLPGTNEVVKDVKQFSVLGGTSILGGVWTFMTGIFSLIFGSSLLLVIFGRSSLLLLLIHMWRLLITFRHKTLVGIWPCSSTTRRWCFSRRGDPSN